MNSWRGSGVKCSLVWRRRNDSPAARSHGNDVGLTGHLELLCARDATGRSVLRHQSFKAPIHVSKPHWDGDVLVVNIVNPTAGLLEGDRIKCDVCVESGGRLLLTTPSASRAHCMSADCAELEQKLRVAAGGFLEFWPELFIPQKGTRYSQQTELNVDGDGELIFFESLAPGRVASGEAFEFDRLDWETNIRANGVLIARERYQLTPEVEAIRTLRSAFPEAYYASGFVVSNRLNGDSDLWERIHALHTNDAWIGCSRLTGSGWVIKIVAAGSIPLRRTLQAVRAHLYTGLRRPVPSLRRAGSR